MLTRISEPLTLDIAPALRPYGGEDVLAYYDGPLLFFLPHPTRHLLAVAAEEGQGRWPFYILELDAAARQALEQDSQPFRDTLLSARACWLMRDYDAQPLVLEPLEGFPEDALPMPGVYLTR